MEMEKEKGNQNVSSARHEPGHDLETRVKWGGAEKPFPPRLSVGPTKRGLDVEAEVHRVLEGLPA